MQAPRYHGIAIGLHWLIALLIIGMLAVGKYMTSLEPENPLRFALTQWHKSFGITLLFLVIWRVLWRFTHKPPSLENALKPWEIKVAETTHWLLYLLMIAIPITGWIMVSASPLNLPTLLFKTIPWPHLPPFDTMPDKKSIADLFLRIHDITASIMIVLLLGHIGAALRHHLLIRDNILSRMSPLNEQRKLVPGFGRFIAILTLLAIGLTALATSLQKSPTLSAGASDIGFTFTMFDSENSGIFTESVVELSYDKQDPGSTTLSATVQTQSLSSGDSQIDSTLPEADWFNVAAHPEATFKSTDVVVENESTLQMTGQLEIKGISREVNFPLTISEESGTQSASGGFTINRLDFDIGKVDQPDDSTVGFNVIIHFNFDLN